MSGLASPLLAARTAAQVNQALTSGALTGGWLISGPPQIGKRTLANALAATVLSGAPRIGDADPDMVAHIAREAHPDFYVLVPTENERGVMRREIVIEDVRRIISAFHRTSMTGRRVAVVDLADQLNRQAANALLKVLEEPPVGTVFLLLATSPGRLLATIRSRCRRLGLAPPGDGDITAWLTATHGVAQDRAAAAARASGGRPGRAFDLAMGEGGDAIRLSDKIFDGLARGDDPFSLAEEVTARKVAAAWPQACEMTLDRVGRFVREGDDHPAFGRANARQLLDLYDDLSGRTARSAALNADAFHTALLLISELKQALENGHAGR